VCGLECVLEEQPLGEGGQWTVEDLPLGASHLTMWYKDKDDGEVFVIFEIAQRRRLIPLYTEMNGYICFRLDFTVILFEQPNSTVIPSQQANSTFL
jgi:hypothetical protein